MTDTPAEPRLLTAEDIEAADDIPEEIVPMPEWGGAVKLRGLSIDDVMALNAKAKGSDGKPDPIRMSILMLAASMAEPSLTPEQVEGLRRKSAGAVTRLIKVASHLSGLGESALGDAERSFRAEPEPGV